MLVVRRGEGSKAHIEGFSKAVPSQMGNPGSQIFIERKSLESSIVVPLHMV